MRAYACLLPIVGLLGVGAAFVPRARDPVEVGATVDAVARGPQLEGRARLRPARLQAREAAGLHARTASARVAALERIVNVGGDPIVLGPRLQELALDPVPQVALWARGALLRIAPTAALREQVARAALDEPGWEEADRLLTTSFPETAGALRAAVDLQRTRSGAGPLPGLAEATAAWIRTARAESAALAPSLAHASGSDLLDWLVVVRGMRPVPREALRALAARLASAQATEAAAIARFFSAGPDLSQADGVVEDALLARALASPHGEAGPWLLALARLPQLSDEALHRATALANRGPEDAQDVAAFRHVRGAGS